MEFEKSRIEKLKSALYSRDEKRIPQERRSPIQSIDSNVPSDWGEKNTFALTEDMVKKNNSFFNKFLYISIGFFVLAVGVATFILFGGFNMISSNNVDIKITAPSSVSSGEELDLGLTILNQNRTDLESATLFVTYPDGSRSADQKNTPLSHDTITVGTIGQGKGTDTSVRAILFGEKDAIKTFTFRIDYKVKGSNAVFSKEKKYDVSIGSSPVLLNVTYPQEINSGQDVTLSIDVTSNSTSVLQNTLVKVEYPFGFTYKSSNMKSVGDNSTWNVGDLKNGEKKTLSVTGTLVGQNSEERSFRVSVGTKNPNGANNFDTDLAVFPVTMSIHKSFFDLSVDDGSKGVGTPGSNSQIGIHWQNTLSDKVLNGRITAILSGNALDKSQVLVNNGGFYRSLDNTIAWDKNSTSNLDTMAPGASDTISFSLSSISSAQIQSIRNPHIDIHVTMQGDRSGQDASTVSSSADMTIKLESTLQLSSKVYRAVGPLTNTGPIPPRADKESTYTITWLTTNTTNDLKDAVVSATLPTGVVWKGEASPSSERVTYNPDNRLVSWNIGNISAGTGYSYTAKQVSFKVGITPSVNQVGTTLPLLPQANMQATDTYTNTTLKTYATPLTTQYSDPSFVAGNDVVQN